MLPGTENSISTKRRAITRALVLEDGAEVREWLCRLLEKTFPEVALTEVATLSEAQQAIRTGKFDLALLDINLPDGSGIELLDNLRRLSPQTLSVMATILDDDENILHALQAGAQGYLLKDQPEERLIACLAGISYGEPPLSPPVARRILSHFREQTPVESVDDPGLSQREQEVLTLVAKGLRRQEIAETLEIKESTVASHIAAVYRKLDVRTRSEATVEAIRLGLIRA